MTEKELIENISNSPDKVEFDAVMGVIDDLYTFTPTAFNNGELNNDAGENNGSCKLFAFARLNGLDEQSTLACFGKYYRVDVLQDPDGESHQNIRNFMKTGWDGIEFFGDPLAVK